MTNNDKFDYIYKTYRVILRKKCLNLTKQNISDADDLLQDVFISIFRSIDKIDIDNRYLKTFLIRCTINRFLINKNLVVNRLEGLKTSIDNPISMSNGKYEAEFVLPDKDDLFQYTDLMEEIEYILINYVNIDHAQMWRYRYIDDLEFVDIHKKYKSMTPHKQTIQNWVYNVNNLIKEKIQNK